MGFITDSQSEKILSFPFTEFRNPDKTKLVYDWIENHWPAKRFVKRIPPKSGELPLPPSSESEDSIDFVQEFTNKQTALSSSSSVNSIPSLAVEQMPLWFEESDAEIIQTEQVPVVYYKESPTFIKHRSYSSSPNTMTSEELYSTSPVQSSSGPLLPSHIAFVAGSSSSTLSSEEIYSALPSMNSSPTMMPPQCQCCVAGCPMPEAPVMNPVPMQMMTSPAFVQAVPISSLPVTNSVTLPSQSQELFKAPQMAIVPMQVEPMIPVILSPVSPIVSPPLVFTPPPIRLHSKLLPAPGFLELRPVDMNEPHHFMVNFLHQLPHQPIIQIHPVLPMAVPVPQLLY